MPFPNASSGFRPGATTTATFDVPDYSLVQDPWWKSLQMLEITGHANKKLTSGVQFLPGIGFQLETLHDSMSGVHEADLGEPVRQAVGGGLLGFASDPTKSVPSLTGVPTGSQVEGDKFAQKHVGAGDDWSSDTYQLSGDSAAFVPPSEDVQFVDCDRVFVGSGPMQPDQPVILRFHVPQLGGIAAMSPIIRVYFTGLNSSPNGDDEGSGRYSLTLRADGIAVLRELKIGGDTTDTASWVKRRNFRWSPAHQVSQADHIIVIRSDAWWDYENESWHGSVINFECQAGQLFQDVQLAINLGLNVSSGTTQYTVPQTKPLNITPEKLRLDIRRDVRAKVSLSFTKFIASGTLQTQVFASPRNLGSVGAMSPDPETNDPDNDPPIQITFSGSFPQGTSTHADIALYTKDGVACTAYTDAGTYDETPSFVYRSFRRKAGVDQYYAVLTLRSSSTETGVPNASPSVRGCTVIRDGLVADGVTAPFNLPAQSLLEYSIMGGGKELTVESASATVASYQDGFTTEVNGVEDPLRSLSTRSGQSVRIEINLPSAVTVNGHSADTSTVFIGKVQRNERTRFGSRRWTVDPITGDPVQEAFPSRTWWLGKLSIAGLWKRLWQAKTTQTYNFGQKDPQTNDLYEVTKIARILMSNAGLPSKMLDIPDVPIRLIYDLDDQEKAAQVEVYQQALEFSMGMVHDLLGGCFLIDPNATNGGPSGDKYGCLRLKLPPRPDPVTGAYAPVAKFVEDATWNDGSLRDKANLNSYDPIDRGDGNLIPVCPVFRGLRDWDEPPEGNVVFVSGTPVAKNGGALSAGQAKEQIYGILHNFPAAQFYDGQPIAVDPTHPDFTDGSPNLILVIDPSLNTQPAVNFATRRIFDFACHRREYRSFEAPLVLVVDPDDTLQIRPRKLQWGDCVLYGNQTWFISNVVVGNNGDKGGTRNASAVYELFRIPHLQEADDAHGSVYHAFQLYGPIAGKAA